MTTLITRRPSRTAQFVTMWVSAGTPQRQRGQVSSGELGLISALAGMRRAVADGELLWATVSHHGGAAIFDSRAGLDVGPRCGVCGEGVCRGGSAHDLNYFMRLQRADGRVKASCTCGWDGQLWSASWWEYRAEFRAHTCLPEGGGRDGR